MMELFIETGKKKVFAGAIEWPGWCRSGKNEDNAILELKNYGSRYAQMFGGSEVDFQTPDSISDFSISERHKGNATTDFGAPSIKLDADSEPITEQDFERLQKILIACWQKLDQAREKAMGKELRKGPRGGGRDLDKILDHVNGANQAYLKRLAWKGENRSVDEMDQARQDMMNALEIAVREGLPEKGPRGGEIWTVRYFIRRTAWHILDHAWEIEDRIMP
jgi:hypothetical protein